MRTDFFTSLNEILQQRKPVVLATIISQHGSSPRGKGARMAISSEKYQIGTIGGGRLEAGLHDKFSEFLERKKSGILDFVLSETEAANLEMICGGSISILIDPIEPDNLDLMNLYAHVQEMILNRKSGWLISWLPESNDKLPQKCLITSDQKVIGTWIPRITFFNDELKSITYNNETFLLTDFDLRVPQLLKSGSAQVFLEPIGQSNIVYIVGAGHISQMLAPLTTLVGFQTIVLDDRDEFISEERFPSVESRVLLQNFNDVFQGRNINTQTFIVIVTRGHQFDKSVLSQALKTPAAYIGMIGSRRKIKLTFEALREEGVSDEELKKVHTPIGLDIGAETPEEIAVSIVAELIQSRAQLKK